MGYVLTNSLTTVINKHHKDSYDIDIGRPSKWGNPYSHLNNTKAQYQVKTREEAIEKYVDWIFTQRHLLADLHELKGKVLGCYCSPAACHGNVLAGLANTTWWHDGRIILECSTAGDKRYSAFHAKVEMFGKKATIEEHYQLSKRFIDNQSREIFIPKSVYDIKGKKSKVGGMEMCWIVIGDAVFHPDFREEFYKWMWLKYLDDNPKLVAYAARFDDYNDIFKGKSTICQADCIRQYIQQGRETIVDQIKLFCEAIGEPI